MAPKTEEDIMLQRLGVLEDSSVNDSDFERESPIADEELASMAEQQQRLDDWEFQLNRREGEVNQKEIDNKREEKRLKRWEATLTALEAELDERKRNQVDEYALDPEEMDAYRKQKKIERLKKSREDAVAGSFETPAVWSTTGWNT